MSVSFEWDARKAASNLRKHEVSFEEALRVFGDPLAKIFDDPETRNRSGELIIGHSTPRRLLIVSFVGRGVRFAFSVQGVRRDAREETMKKAPRETKQRGDEGMRPEYRLDYAEARQNRFAGRVPTDVVAVVLDPGRDEWSRGLRADCGGRHDFALTIAISRPAGMACAARSRRARRAAAFGDDRAAAGR